ncbi:hypothetical protein MnTg02_00817 [bacterium MnTg02]|nr:hypothetical protein MnTg02_00817 [bacterium MnTg02]
MLWTAPPPASGTSGYGTERTNGFTAGVFRYPALSRHNNVDVCFLQVFVCSGMVNGLVGQQAERTVVDPSRTLQLSQVVEHWSLTSLRKKLVKIGANVATHGGYVALQMAEVAVPRDLFREILC